MMSLELTDRERQVYRGRFHDIDTLHSIIRKLQGGEEESGVLWR